MWTRHVFWDAHVCDAVTGFSEVSPFCWRCYWHVRHSRERRTSTRVLVTRYSPKRAFSVATLLAPFWIAEVSWSVVYARTRDREGTAARRSQLENGPESFMNDSCRKRNGRKEMIKSPSRRCLSNVFLYVLQHTPAIMTLMFSEVYAEVLPWQLFTQLGNVY